MKHGRFIADVVITPLAYLFMFLIGWVSHDLLNYIFILMLSYFIVDWFMADIDFWSRKGRNAFHWRFTRLFSSLVVTGFLADGMVKNFDPYLQKNVEPLWADALSSLLIVMAFLGILVLNPRRMALRRQGSQTRQDQYR